MAKNCTQFIDHERIALAPTRVAALSDLLFEERDYQPIASCQTSSESIRREWFEHLMLMIQRKEVADLLATRHYVIIQGPPGTGKTRMATNPFYEL